MNLEAHAYFLSSRRPPNFDFCLKTAHPKSRKRRKDGNTERRIGRFFLAATWIWRSHRGSWGQNLPDVGRNDRGAGR